ncbi:ornithine carbamoyltransferase [Planctomycetaceae bacterium]|nr:ornithine carbamoyltransferase [Planctomycetaceae bacterium]
MHLLTIAELNRQEIDTLLKMAATGKARHKMGIPYNPLRGKTLGLIFEKSSTRTRVSFETAMNQLGGSSIFISQRDSQIGRGEPIKDTARVMSRYVDAIVIRTFGHEIIEEYAKYSAVPVINGLTDLHHPCQVLADVLTIVEKKGGYEGMKVCWIGDGNNMANSWIEAAGVLGFELVLACPKGYHPHEGILKKAASVNPKIRVTGSVEEAATGADVLNTDVWASMGQEEEASARRKAFEGFQINSRVLGMAKSDAIVLHCLPAHRGEEITEEVMEGPQSAIWDEAENRLHIQKAVLERLLVKV